MLSHADRTRCRNRQQAATWSRHIKTRQDTSENRSYLKQFEAGFVYVLGVTGQSVLGPARECGLVVGQLGHSRPDLVRGCRQHSGASKPQHKFSNQMFSLVFNWKIPWHSSPLEDLDELYAHFLVFPDFHKFKTVQCLQWWVSYDSEKVAQRLQSYIYTHPILK